jgi:sugar lactone lactonase YvrE
MSVECTAVAGQAFPQDGNLAPCENPAPMTSFGTVFNSDRSVPRRAFLRDTASWTCGVAAAAVIGCAGGDPNASPYPADLVWGTHGELDGQFFKPRAIAINAADELFIVDITARIQVFTTDGKFLRSWRTPESTNGRPTGLGISSDGKRLLVADTHYFRMLEYTFEGELFEDKTIGGVCGHEPGEFHFVTDAVQDKDGNYYIGEYGEFDRIQKFTSDRKFLFDWGSHGEELGQFVRPQALAIDGEGLLWVSDACNHRVQVFDARGDSPKLVKHWGTMGEEEGQLRYPYGIVLDGKGHVYLSEFGNHRIQKFTTDGKFVARWGQSGRRHGELYQPWSCALDSKGRLHVLDSYNHRVQRTRI